MAESRRYGPGDQLVNEPDRWLRPAEICEILENYEKFLITQQPAYMPASGSLFLFNRKEQRFFRNDGHDWRKKKDGKFKKESHTMLKVGGSYALDCYYAYGEENENFQRRSYWMLDEDLSDIVLVHYRLVPDREVKSNRKNLKRTKQIEEAEGILPISEIDREIEEAEDTTSLNSAQELEYGDTESEYNCQARLAPFPLSQQPMVKNAGLTDPHFPASVSNDYQGKSSSILRVDFVSLALTDKAKESNNTGLKDFDFACSEDVVENGTSGSQTVTLQPSFLEGQPDTIGVLGKGENQRPGQLVSSIFGERQEFLGHPQVQEEWQTSEGKWPLDGDVHTKSAHGVISRLHEQDVNRVNVLNSLEPCLAHTDKQEIFPKNDIFEGQLSNAGHGYYLDSGHESKVTLEEKTNNSIAIKQPQFDGYPTEALENSLNWDSTGLGDINESCVLPSSVAYFNEVDCSLFAQSLFEDYTLGPSLSLDQLFSIIDISPNWAYEGSKIEVLITGRFFKNQQEAENCEWSCMFGEVEVPAKVIDGVLQCHAPIQKPARVPFYVTLSDRFACSEVREFEYRSKPVNDVDIMDDYSGNGSEILKMRFVKLLSLGSACPLNSDYFNLSKKSQLSNNVSSLLKGNYEWRQMLKLTSEMDCSPEKVQEKLTEKQLKEKFHIWLMVKEGEGGKGHSVLGTGGQGVLHLAAALGYDWALQPTKLAGVSVNFRDVNGWTALHWAAFCGRERTVVSLVYLGAAPDVVTEYPSGRTPADLASANGHNGIARYLEESALSANLSSLKLDTKEGDAAEISGAKAVQTISERRATPIRDGDLPDGLSQKDSLAAVCNAHQASYTGITEGRRMGDTSSKEDDYDFLKEGRKQTEETLHNALAGVKPMVQNPDAGDQYRRLLNVEAEILKTKVDDRVVNGSEETVDSDDLKNLEKWLDEDTDMPTAI